jgi:biotin carboxyl carrier protein
MNKYNIKVNGISYEVEVEEVKGDFASNPVPVAVTKATPVKASPVPVAKVKKTAAVGEKIECPMPGTVLKVNVNVGDSVKKGHVIFVLEAMKMENEIMAPHDAKILEVNVAQGATVNTGDVLAIIE